MTTATLAPENSQVEVNRAAIPPISGDALLDLQLRIARRADQLVCAQQGGAGLNWHCWLIAEAEIIGRMGESPPAVDGTRLKSTTPGELLHHG